MPVSFAQELASLRAKPEEQARIDELAGKANEGVLTDEERTEYAAYIDAFDILGILQTKARSVLAKQSDAFDELIDHDFVKYCEREADDSVTLEEVRAATSKIKDSMARVIIEEERAERF